jgi:DNA-binding transcriptional ArsR family regulator
MSIESTLAIPPGIQQDDTDELANLCKALGHPARIKILQHLLTEDRCICGRIVEVLPLAQSTVSQHLKILKESELVQGEVEGPKTCYCVDKNKLSQFCKTMSALFSIEEEK